MAEQMDAIERAWIAGDGFDEEWLRREQQEGHCAGCRAPIAADDLMCARCMEEAT